MPRLKKHFDRHGIDSGIYTLKWFFQCFLDRVSCYYYYYKKKCGFQKINFCFSCHLVWPSGYGTFISWRARESSLQWHTTFWRCTESTCPNWEWMKSLNIFRYSPCTRIFRSQWHPESRSKIWGLILGNARHFSSRIAKKSTRHSQSGL